MMILTESQGTGRLDSKGTSRKGWEGTAGREKRERETKGRPDG